MIGPLGTGSSALPCFCGVIYSTKFGENGLGEQISLESGDPRRAQLTEAYRSLPGTAGGPPGTFRNCGSVG